MTYIVYFLIIFTLVCNDQISKFLVSTFIPLNSKKVIIENFFSLYHTRNTGIAFSMFEGQQGLFKVLTVIALIVFIYLLLDKKKKSKIEIASLLLMTGGCIGNFIDRIRFNYVVDFLSFRFFGYDFAIFNLADCFLTIGAGLYLILLIKEVYNAKH